MKYAFLIPMGEQMVPQMSYAMGVPRMACYNEDGKIFSLCLNPNCRKKHINN